MRCPQCGVDSQAGKNFCGDCGAPLAITCASCGSANPGDENGCCRVCAAVLDRAGFAEPAASWRSGGSSGTPGEIRPVTVLYSDIVGSTALTRRIGAEAMHELLSRFLDSAFGEVERYGGNVAEFTGDGFMALFGAPLTQEDHVRRALLSAIAVQHTLRAARETDGQHPTDFQIRIGIDTGPVVFGPISPSFRKKTAIGDAANLGARLQQAAAPGEILVSEAVHALSQGYATFEPVGPLTVPGKREIVTGYRLLGVSIWRAARDAVSPARQTSFVGRGSELALLEDLLRQVKNGQGRMVGIVGEPGIGKSRLLAEFRRRVEGCVTWVDGRCFSYGSAIPYQLALDLLRGHCSVGETDSAEAIAEKVRAGLRDAAMDAGQDSPVLLHLLGLKVPGDAPSLSNPEAIKAKSFEVLQRLCLNGSRRRPLVLALEDLHWIDAISEELLEALAQQVGNTSILLLASYRPEYWKPWARNLGMAEISLRPLSRDDSSHIVKSTLRGAELTDPLTEEIVSRADGNPLFLEQLALHAGETGAHLNLMVPQTIHGVVMARIDRLPEPEKQLLQTAAVIGREFSLRLLRAVWQGREPLEIQLHELSRLEFLDEWPDDEGTAYVFRHALTQESAYASLLERDRRRRHAAIGKALEQLYRDRTDEVAELLALHFDRSDDAEKAVDYATAAAVKAGRGWANTEAVKYFDAALRRLDAMSNTANNRLRRIDAVLKQAEVKYGLGRYAEQITSLEEIQNLIEELGNARLRATWYYWTGFLHSVSGGRPEVATGYCEEAVKIAASAGLEEINAFAQSCLAQIYLIAGMPRKAIAVGERAVATFEACNNPWWAALTFWHMSSSANYLGEWDSSIKYCRRGLQHGIALRDTRLQIVSWSRMGSAYIQRGDLEEGLKCCDEAFGLAPMPRDAALTRAIRAYGEFKAGRVDVGIAELSRALRWFKTSQMRYTYLRYALWLAEAYLCTGDQTCALKLINDGLSASQETGYYHLEGLWHWLMAECCALEAPKLAENHIHSAVELLGNAEARNDLGRAMLTQAALCQRAGDAETARELLFQASAIFQELGTRGEFGHATAAVALLQSGGLTPLLAGQT